MSYSRDEVSSDLEIEKDILTGMIINTSYLREVADMVDIHFFKIDSLRKVSQWVLAYYRKYKTSPFNDLQSIYVAESIKLKPAESEIIKIFLQELSERYQEGDPFNKDYWVDKTILFCKDRALETLQKKIEGYRLQGNVEKAEEAVRGFFKISQSTSQWVNPFDPEEIERTFEEDEANRLFMLPGILGEMMGWLERGWLISFMGPTKRGKCLTGDALISLMDGRRKRLIDIINDKDWRALTLKGNGKIGEGRILNHFCNGKKMVYLLKTWKGKAIKATLNHPFLTPLGWKELGDLKIGTDHIAIMVNKKKQWDKIILITEIGIEETYDIEIEDSHNFVADDCIVHNSYYSWETVYQALTCKLKVAIFSFEMNKTTNKKRIYKRLTAMAEEGGEYAYPVFDCFHNQDGTCNLVQRQNKVKLIDANNVIPVYKKELKYKVCDYCRKDRGFRDRYKSATWWQTQIQEKDLSPDIIKRKVAGFKKMFGSNLRLIAPPSFSVGFDFIESKLDQLEYTEGFVPDIILTDSLDITEQEVANELQDENIKWMKAKRLAGTRHALVINCNQGNRDSDEKVTIKKKHTGGTIKKLQNVDVEFTLNQTDDEKKQGVMRIEVLVNRHDESTEKGQVYVLQQLKLGMPNLDSEWVDRKR